MCKFLHAHLFPHYLSHIFPHADLHTHTQPFLPLISVQSCVPNDKILLVHIILSALLPTTTSLHRSQKPLSDPSISMFKKKQKKKSFFFHAAGSESSCVIVLHCSGNFLTIFFLEDATHSVTVMENEYKNEIFNSDMMLTFCRFCCVYLSPVHTSFLQPCTLQQDCGRHNPAFNL